MVESVPMADLPHRLALTKFEHGAGSQMERTMLAKTTIALATAAILGVVSVAQAAPKDKGEGSVGGRIIQPLNYERYGNPRFFRDVPQAPNPVIPDDYEGYPHPR